MEMQEIQFTRIGKVFLIGYDSSVAKNGWTNFIIRKEGRKGFRASYSVVEKRFARGKDFMKLHEGTRNDALQFAQTIFGGQ